MTLSNVLRVTKRGYIVEIDKILKNILVRLENIEKALSINVAANADVNKPIRPGKTLKAITLPELARSKKAVNGQQKVAIVVGYYERITRKDPITKNDIKEGWKEGKFPGSFADVLVHRAIKDGLIRDLKGKYDLSQTGEDFFDDFTPDPKEKKSLAD
jgi:hypothetical protein